MERFSRPPTDALYTSQTSAYWLKWHYEELARSRESIGREIEDLSSQIPHGVEERQAQQSAQDRLLSRYNKLGDMFGLPQVDLARQLEEDLQAAREGKMPSFMRKADG